MSPAALTRYRAKRDFSQTPEPAGKITSPGQSLSFVVQRHAARRLHYDLRLEWHGVMKSWAVTRGPSLDPADKRLAVEVEDHPVDYASFEGTIPKPSYGGGTVQVWDRGEWAPLDPGTVDDDLAKGELKFVLFGERLRGGFVLVRMRPRRGETERHKNWLLIKERDDAATPGQGDAILQAGTSVLSGRTMDEIGDGIDPGPDEPSSTRKSPAKRSVAKQAPANAPGKQPPPAQSAVRRARANKGPIPERAVPRRRGPVDAPETPAAGAGRNTPDPAPAPDISHPDRVLWPATNETPPITKADLAAYYALYAERILAQVRGRPLSVLRAPDGITSQLFLQRHGMRGQSPLIGTVRIAGQAKPYLRVDDASGLAALAQISVVELHPWGARAETPDIPDRLVFDLDPAEGLKFDAVITAGLELRERLTSLGLASFARVTGGKGLHVVVPLTHPRRASPPGWAEAKQFTHLVCAAMERDAPTRYTTAMAKRARGGKIFLDYLRNDRTATAIASWSPRGRPGAPIARPVPWSAVKPGLESTGWRLPAMLASKPPRDPWAGFEAAGGDLRAAIFKAANL